MLTCTDLRERIPAIEAGEPASGAERDHLAACEACRDESARVRDDLERVRRDLAGLAPSPFLEDAVRDVAIDTAPAAAGGHRGTYWLAGAAAVVMLGIAVFLATEPTPRTFELQTHVGGDDGDQADEKGPPEGGAPRIDLGPMPPSGVAFPPTALAVESTRANRQRAAKPKHRFLSLGVRPTPGHAVIGAELLARVLPARGESDDPAARVEAAWARLTDGGRRRGIDVLLVHPTTQANALVRAIVDRRYTGSLLLEEPVARALGLHTLELPGSVSITGAATMTALRTEATVVLGDGVLETRFEERLEVQMRRRGDPHPLTPIRGGGIPPQPRLELIGERPDMGFVGNKLGLHAIQGRFFVSADRNVPWRDGAPMPLSIPMEAGKPLQAAVEYREGDHPLCYVYLPFVDIGEGGPLAWRVPLERVTLEGTFEPGAEIAVARVWQGTRGHEAVPTRDSAVFTKADANGRVSFVHVRGEAGPLRLRERRKDGSIRWHRVLIPRAGELPGTELRVAIDGHGTIQIGDAAFHLERDVHAVGPTHRWTEGGARDALLAFLTKAADAGGRDKDLVSHLRMHVVPQDNTPWTAVTGLLMACAHPKIRIDKIRFGKANGGRSIDYDLPKDVGLIPARDPKALKPLVMNILLERRGERTFYRVRDEVNKLVSDSTTGPGRKEFAHAIRKFRKEGLRTGRPMRIDLAPYTDVPYDHVRDVMGLLKAAKLEGSIRLMSSPR